jgi:hypothetical protein
MATRDCRGGETTLPGAVPFDNHHLIRFTVSRYRWFADTVRRTTGKQLQ